MDIVVSITDRLNDSLNEYCSFNGMDVNEYICGCIERQLNTDKYGDMNKMMNIGGETVSNEYVFDDMPPKSESSSEDNAVHTDGRTAEAPAVKKTRRTLKSK